MAFDPRPRLGVMGMSKPFHKSSVKKPPYVKKFIPWIYTSSCGTANTQLFECLFTGVQDLPSGPPRLYGRPAFGRPPSEASEVPREGPATPVNSIHSWVFSVTALGAVVSRKKLLTKNVWVEYVRAILTLIQEISFFLSRAYRKAGYLTMVIAGYIPANSQLAAAIATIVKSLSIGK